MLRKASFILISLSLSACASYQTKVAGPLHAMKTGHPQQAADSLKPLAEKESDDQLVFLLEYATALQMAGKYEESNRTFLKADKLSEIQDYHSLSRIAGSVLLNEGMVQYKGDDFEKVLINAFLAMNYLSMGMLDDARVEARRLNEKLYKYKFEAKREYEQNSFAYYISALIWESEGEWDSAFIDYQKAYDLAPNMSFIKEDLVRSAYMSRRSEPLQKYKSEFNISIKPEWKDKSTGELVVIFQQGIGPEKKPNPSFVRVPKLFPRYSFAQYAKVQLPGYSDQKTELVYDVQDVAIKTLDDQYAGLVGKRVAGIVAKEVVAYKISEKNELLGALAWITMHASDQADLRQWSSLPQTLQLAKQRLSPGEYTLTLEAMDGSDRPTGAKYEQRIKIEPNKKTFVVWRAF